MGDRSPARSAPAAHKRNRQSDCFHDDQNAIELPPHLIETNLPKAVADCDHVHFVAKKPRDENAIDETGVDEETRHSNEFDDDYDDEEDDDYDDLVRLNATVTKCIKYSGDLNTRLVWYLNGQKLSDCRMIRYSNAI